MLIAPAQCFTERHGNGKCGKGGNKVKSTRERKTERKRGRKVKRDRKRDGYSKVPIHSLPPLSNPTSPRTVHCV